MRLTTRTGLAAIVVVATLLAACGEEEPSSLGEPTAGSVPSDEARSWLYSLQSEGTTTFDADASRLSMPVGLVHAFTDRPHRDTRLTAPATFAGLWSRTDTDSFAQDPPNAVLTYWEGQEAQGYPSTVVCEITGGVDYDPDSGRISMDLRVLDPEDAELPSTMSDASLFVDDGPVGCTDDPDEDIIEYFNLINYMQDFALEMASKAADSYELSLLCPRPEGMTTPPPEFELVLTAPGGGPATSCAGGDPLTVSRTSDNCDSDGLCDFVVILTNRATERTLSTTEIQLALKADEKLVLDLNDATAPIICP